MRRTVLIAGKVTMLTKLRVNLMQRYAEANAGQICWYMHRFIVASHERDMMTTMSIITPLSCRVFNVACRFHHPPLTAQQRAVHAARTQERIKWDKNKPGAVKIGPHGLPLRPNANECPHYTKYGACGFGVVSTDSP